MKSAITAVSAVRTHRIPTEELKPLGDVVERATILRQNTPNSDRGIETNTNIARYSRTWWSEHTEFRPRN